jgi:thiamine phosphate synthase YjbQ (UPF0047 family)
VDVIDVADLVNRQTGGFFDEYEKSVFCSYHTTAGYFEQSLISRLGHNADAVQAFVLSFSELFPAGAGYRHDEMHLRAELTDEQRQVEPRNADSHLTFIGCGLENCVTYLNRPQAPVYFVELDGVNGPDRRRRRTSVIGFTRAETIDRFSLEIPVSGHRIDSINLWDPALGLYERLHELVRIHGVSKGRIDIALDPRERNAGLTVNEYETLLMRHDLAEVLRNPIRFMAQKGRNMLRDPRAIPDKARDYAKYDLVRVVNEFIDAMGLNESLIERIIDRFLAVPAARFLRMKRGVSLVVNGAETGTPGRIISGTYQSPILVQWRKADRQVRHVEVTYTRFV